LWEGDARLDEADVFETSPDRDVEEALRSRKSGS
jgi:hypothetical protein